MCSGITRSFSSAKELVLSLDVAPACHARPKWALPTRYVKYIIRNLFLDSVTLIG